jgi:hypothetical protein
MGCGLRYFILFIIIFGGIITFHLLYVYPELLKISRDRVPYNDKIKLPSWYRNYVEYFENQNHYENNSYIIKEKKDSVNKKIIKQLNDKFEVTAEKIEKNPKLLKKLLNDPYYKNSKKEIENYLKAI